MKMPKCEICKNKASLKYQYAEKTGELYQYHLFCSKKCLNCFKAQLKAQNTLNAFFGFR